jgi:hypothetical protein
VDLKVEHLAEWREWEVGCVEYSKIKVMKEEAVVEGYGRSWTGCCRVAHWGSNYPLLQGREVVVVVSKNPSTTQIGTHIGPEPFLGVQGCSSTRAAPFQHVYIITLLLGGVILLYLFFIVIQLFSNCSIDLCVSVLCRTYFVFLYIFYYLVHWER